MLCDIFGVSMDELMRGDVTASRRPAPKRAEEDELYCTPEEAEKIKKFSDLSPKAKKYALSQIVRRIVAAALLTCSLVCYLCIGCLLDLWHPGWLIFLLCFYVVAFTDRLFVKPKGMAPRPVISRIFKGLSDMALPLGLTIYLFAGFCYSLWHPTWIVFIVALAFSALTDQIASLIAHGAQNKTA